MPNKLDSIDRAILAELQADAKLTNTELAGKVNLSPTPCLRRVKRLEQEGFIQSYITELSKEKLGLQISAFVFVQLVRNSKENAAAFEQAILAFEEVMDRYVLTGEHDYLLNVVAKSLASYDVFVKEKLASVNQIAKIDTTIVLNQVKSKRALPLNP